MDSKKTTHKEAIRLVDEERGSKWARDEVRLAWGFEIHDRWISETAMVQAIRLAFPDDQVTREDGPAWLSPQRFDAWIPSLNIAFEYQGAQHYEPVDFFGGISAFDRRQELDQRKRALCQQHGVRLVEVHEGEVLSPTELRHCSGLAEDVGRER